MKKLTFLIALLLLFLTSSPVNAHSGRTDSSGGHNCYVGACAGTYHYHNSGYTAPAPVYNPSTPKPTPVPTLKPTPVPTPKVTFTPKPTVAPTPTPEVQGEQTSKPTQSPPSQVSPDSSTGNTFSQFLGWTGVTFFAYLIYRNRKSKKIEKKGGDKK